MLLVGSLICADNIDYLKMSFSDNGRFYVWQQVSSDIKNGDARGKSTFTGIGPGSFTYLHHVDHDKNELHATKFFQAHNEYLETARNIGLFGLIVMVLAFGKIFRDGFRKINSHYGREIIACLSCLVCIALCAFGTFVFQIHAIIFVSVFMLGVLYKFINSIEEG